MLFLEICQAVPEIIVGQGIVDVRPDGRTDVRTSVRTDGDDYIMHPLRGRIKRIKQRKHWHLPPTLKEIQPRYFQNHFFKFTEWCSFSELVLHVSVTNLSRESSSTKHQADFFHQGNPLIQWGRKMSWLVQLRVLYELFNNGGVIVVLNFLYEYPKHSASFTPFSK